MQYKDIHALGVSIMDNDFSDKTLMRMLDIYSKKLEYFAEIDTSREIILRDLNNLIFPSYLIFQARNEVLDPKSAEHIKNYLVIKDRNLWINKELEAHLDRGNSNADVACLYRVGTKWDLWVI